MESLNTINIGTTNLFEPMVSDPQIAEEKRMTFVEDPSGFGVDSLVDAQESRGGWDDVAGLSDSGIYWLISVVPIIHQSKLVYLAPQLERKREYRELGFCLLLCLFSRNLCVICSHRIEGEESRCRSVELALYVFHLVGIRH